MIFTSKIYPHKLKAMSATKQPTVIIRPKMASDYLISQFELTTAKQKSDLAERINNEFYERDGSSYAKVHVSQRDEKAKLAEAKRQAERLKKCLADIGTKTNAETIKWANEKNINIPSDTPAVSTKSYISELYKKKQDEVEAEVVRLTASVKSYADTVAECDKLLTAYKKENKKEYVAWKTGVLSENSKIIKKLRDQLTEDEDNDRPIKEEIAKLSDNFARLRAALAVGEFSQQQRESYTLRLEKDALSNKMVRFADADKHLAHYSNEIIKHFYNNVLRQYLDTIKVDIATLLSEGYSHPKITLEHVKPQLFSAGPVCSLYLGILVEQAKNVRDATEEEEQSKYYKAINSYVKNTLHDNTFTRSCEYDSKLIALITRTVLEFNHTICLIIHNKIAQKKIRTFQEKLITDIFRLSYVSWGQQPYEVPKVKAGKGKGKRVAKKSA